MTAPRFAWLAPELPSVSGTFVFREIEACRALGVRIVPFSLHAPESARLGADARAFLAETEVVYGSTANLLRGAWRFIRRRPGASIAVLATAFVDMCRGVFDRPSKRLKVPFQAIAGLHLADRLIARGITHLHVHFAHSPANVGMYAARAAGIPWSATAHANDLWVEASLLREKVRRAHAFVTISEVNRRFIAERAGVAPAAIDVVHCGVDTADWNPGWRDADAGSSRTVIGIGRLVPKKGFDLLLEATAPLLADGRITRLVIAGDGPERATLVARAAELGIADRVELPGAVDRERIRELLAGAATFVLPCRVSADGDRDGIPVALMEAMAAGVPVISTDVSGVPELIQDGRNGRCVPPQDVGALRGALERLLGDAAHARALAAAARHTVEADFDRDVNAARLLACVTPRGGCPETSRIVARAQPAAPAIAAVDATTVHG